jgi:hypothetical protein
MKADRQLKVGSYLPFRERIIHATPCHLAINNSSSCLLSSVTIGQSSFFTVPSLAHSATRLQLAGTISIQPTYLPSFLPQTYINTRRLSLSSSQPLALTISCFIHLSSGPTPLYISLRLCHLSSHITITRLIKIAGHSAL